MKIIKLDKRFSMYKEGYTHAMRWPRWEPRIINPYKEAMCKMYGENWYSKGSPWKIQFGTKGKSDEYAPYFIYVKTESMLTMLMLGLINDDH